jgi:hypothetical protein
MELSILWQLTEKPPGLKYGLTKLMMAKSIDGGETFTPAISVINKNDSIQAKNFEGLDLSDNGTIYIGSLNTNVKVLGNGTYLTDNTNGVQPSLITSEDGKQTITPNFMVDLVHINP